MVRLRKNFIKKLYYLFVLLSISSLIHANSAISYNSPISYFKRWAETKDVNSLTQEDNTMLQAQNTVKNPTNNLSSDFEKDKQYYFVDDKGRVDKRTYNGWRRFGTCAGCHGPEATGGTSGPNLLLAISNKKIDFTMFKEIVSEGRLEKGMPAWKHDPNVNKYYADIYGYLRARSDKAISRGGRPNKIPKI